MTNGSGVEQTLANCYNTGQILFNIINNVNFGSSTDVIYIGGLIGKVQSKANVVNCVQGTNPNGDYTSGISVNVSNLMSGDYDFRIGGAFGGSNYVRDLNIENVRVLSGISYNNTDSTYNHVGAICGYASNSYTSTQLTNISNHITNGVDPLSAMIYGPDASISTNLTSVNTYYSSDAIFTNCTQMGYLDNLSLANVNLPNLNSDGAYDSVYKKSNAEMLAEISTSSGAIYSSTYSGTIYKFDFKENDTDTDYTWELPDTNYNNGLPRLKYEVDNIA